MFRVTLICHGLPAKSGEEAARNITNEFTNHRKWHDSVRCEWDGTRLVLKSENDFDTNGKATFDEFSDCILAYVADPGKFSISVESVDKFI